MKKLLSVIIGELFEVELIYVNVSNVKVKIAIILPKTKANPLLWAIESSKWESATIKKPNINMKRKRKIAAQSKIKS
jgi:hypothetical protein